MLRKAVLMYTLCLMLVFNPVQAFAQGIPNGIEPRKLTASVVDEYPGSLLTFLPGDAAEKLSGLFFEGAPANMPYKKKYTLEFYNVGALKGEEYSEATLKIETVAAGNGGAGTWPDFKAREYKLKFSGGPYGRFTYKKENTEITMSMSNDGKAVVFDVPGYSTKPLALEEQNAFEAWVKAAGSPAAAEQKLLDLTKADKYLFPAAAAILVLGAAAAAAVALWKGRRAKLLPH